MALTVVTPDGLDITGNYLFNGLSVTANLVTSNATITGNLIVNGNTVYANVETLNVKDPIIEQGGNPNGDPLTTNDSKDRGSLLHYYTSAPIDAFMGWDTSNNEFAFGSNVTATNNVVTFNTFGNVRADYFLGNGSQLTGITATTANTANTANTAATVTTNAQPNITSVGTLSSLVVTGNITAGNVNGANLISANFFQGDGGLLTNIASAGSSNTIYSGNSNVTVDANSNVRISVAGTANVLIIGAADSSLSGNLEVTGNITAGSGSGGTIGGANLVSANFFTGTLTTAAQPNITSIGNLTALTVTGNANVGNIGANNAVFTSVSGNGAALSSITGANVTGTVANANNAVLATSATSATVAATVTTNAQPNITSVGTLASLDVTGNVSGNYFIGNGSLLTGIAGGNSTAIVNGTSNVVVDLNSNVSVGAAGNANIVVVTGTGVIFTGTANVVGNLIASNIVISGSGGNISGANDISANTFTGILTTSAQPNITSLGNLTALTVTGNIISGNANLGNAATSNYFIGNLYGTANTAVIATSATSATLAATVTTNAQPNITSVGTLTLLNVTGNTEFSGANISLGSVSNLHITGGTANYVLQTDGTGNLSWVTQSGGGGSANIVIKNEGNILTNNVSSIDFVGSSVDATVVGNAVTVTVSGGGSGGQATITSDTFTGNGVQTAFVLSTIPESIDSTFVNIDGVNQLRNAYTVSGSTLTFTAAPDVGAEIEVTIIQAVTNGYSNLETRNYTGNGVQTTFTVTSGVTSTGLLVTENGVLQTPETDYTVSSANLIFVTAPANGVNIQVRELQTVIPEPVGEGLVYSRSSVTATAGQTNFAVAYTVGYLQVFLNGVLLNAIDYVATTGSTIVLNDAAVEGDLLEIITYNLIPFNQIQTATFNSTNLTSNMVITAGYSAMSVGPLSVADGVTISIAAGQKWVIL